ncbi:MAG: hypothetical protein DLM61_19830 [Pseudonocardiales bacterium]|nr:MAG: hypothetical protein DLM61_19830 [Pseudonocardiales bacterium]
MNRIELDVRRQLPLLFGLVLVGGYLLITIVELARSSYDIAGGLLVLPVLAVLSVPLLARAQRTEPDSWIGGLFAPGLLAMMSMGLIHFFVSFILYRGVADARLYSARGAALSSRFWQGDFGPNLGYSLVGVGFVILLTGLMYALIGPTLLGGYLVYSWLAFWGLYLCYRAFRTAMPGADHRRYAVLVFFLPSVVFWSSGLGKEAWMILCSGLTLLGAARLLSSTARWALPLIAGLAGTSLVRPHITAILFVGLLTGMLIRKTAYPTLLSPIVRAVTTVVLVVVGAVVVSQAARFLHLDTLSVDSVNQVLNNVQGNTSEIGNSTFAAHPVNSPLDLPRAVLSVLFRPFPWEARSLLILASSAESALLLVFAALAWRRWRRVPVLLRQYPYVMLAVVATLLFVIAFSRLGNFGLLVRERVTIMPLVFVPLCLPFGLRRRRAISDPALPGEVATMPVS